MFQKIVRLFHGNKNNPVIPELKKEISIIEGNDSNSTAKAVALKAKGDQLFGESKFGEAKALYQESLFIDPNFVDALVNLGVLFREQNLFPDAIRCFERAISINPKEIYAHYNCGIVFQIQGDIRNAIKQFETTVEYDPYFDNAYMDLAILHCQLGNFRNAREILLTRLSLTHGLANFHYFLGKIYLQESNLESAILSFQEVLTLQPNNTDAHFSMGAAFHSQNKSNEAVLCYQNALKYRPEYPEALDALARAYAELDLSTEAENCFCKAVAISPESALAHHNLGFFLQTQHRFSEAEKSYRRALLIQPNYADAHNHLGSALQEQGHFAQAEASYRQALSIQANYPSALCNLGTLLASQNRVSEAESCYRTGLRIQPIFPDCYFGLGNLLMHQGRLDEAAAAFDSALKQKPAYVEALCNLGNILKDQNRFEESEINYRKAIEIAPTYANAHNCLGTLLLEQGRLDAAKQSYQNCLLVSSENMVAHSNLLLLLATDPGCSSHQYLEELRIYAAKVLNKAKPYTSWPAVDATAKVTTLKIGLISGDFRHHPVGFFLENVLSHLNTERIELTAYSTHAHEDTLTARIKPYFKAWNQLVGMDDEAAARRIHADGMHILIDLAGHTANNRLPVFAWKPAQIQVSWLGYFASTGVPGMDYVLADPVAVPPAHQDQFTETVWYLPNTRLCFSSPTTSETIEVAALPALCNGYLTFGCFQGMAKLTDQVLALWGRVFKALPQARLRLQNRYMTSPIARQEMQQRLSQVGISEERVTLVGPVTRDVYLASHAEVDMILDTFPYTGGTTTCEALWMGVPTLTLAGDTMLSLQGASMLECAGLTEWIAKDKDDYVARAVELSSNLEALAALRAGLREKVLASPLFDAQLFARNFEDALHGMWQKKGA
jgi:protein O-GlcNAc transferase